jgi:hypothetical protein
MRADMEGWSSGPDSFRCVLNTSQRTESTRTVTYYPFNPLNVELNPICQLVTLLGSHPILHVSRYRIKDEWKIA